MAVAVRKRPITVDEFIRMGETGILKADERLEGSLAATAVAGWLGATVFRAHDVRATRRLVDMVATIRGDRPPRRAVRGVQREA